MKTTEIYSYDDATNTYEKKSKAADDSDLLSSATGSGDSCQCANYLKEIHYKVQLEIQQVEGKSQYVIKKDGIDSTVVVAKNPVTGVCGAPTAIQQ